MTKKRKTELQDALKANKTVTFTRTILNCPHMDKPIKVSKITRTRVIFEDEQYMDISDIFPEEYFTISS